MPPRLLPEEYGFLDTVRHDNAESVWMKGEVVNSLAAMPSMHFGLSISRCYIALTNVSRLFFLHRLYYLVSLWHLPTQSHQGRGSQIGVLEVLVCVYWSRIPTHGAYCHCFDGQPLFSGCNYGYGCCDIGVLQQSDLFDLAAFGGLLVMVSADRKADP